MAEGKVTQLHTPRNVPPPEPTPAEKLLLRSKGVDKLDFARHTLGEARRLFTHSGDEQTAGSCQELAEEISALLDGLAVGR